MDTGVREILVKALNQSAATMQLMRHWEFRFPKADQDLWYEYDQQVSADYVKSVNRHYTPAEILSILAVARFEGIWSPE